MKDNHSHLLAAMASLNIAIEQVRASLVYQELRPGPAADLMIVFRKLCENKGHLDELVKFWKEKGVWD